MGHHPTIRTRYVSSALRKAALRTLLLLLVSGMSVQTQASWPHISLRAVVVPPIKSPIDKKGDAKPKPPLIDKINVVGNKALSKTFILTLAKCKIGDSGNSEALAAMQKRLVESAYFGFHSVHEADAVRVEAKETGKGKCQVTITVDENETIKSINLSGTDPLKMEDVRPLLHPKVGEVYNDRQFLLDALAIQDLYRKQGYIATLTESGIDNKGILNVPIVVTRVVEVKVVGNQKTSTVAILAAMTSKAGDYLNINALDKDQKALLDSPQLKLESVKIADEAAGAGRINLTITVEEAK